MSSNLTPSFPLSASGEGEANDLQFPPSPFTERGRGEVVRSA